MGLFDSVIGNVLGSSAAQGALQSVLGSILGGSQPNPPPGAPPAVQAGGGLSGGLAGLVEQFSRAGLGNVVGSWIGNGQNEQVSPQALGQVFGHQQVDQWAQQTGMSHEGLLASLAQVLPHAVDQATPNGNVPANPNGEAPASAFDEPGLELPDRR